ncbi:hypothetical protein CATRI_00080 [Corynebacterium atrinae]|uniref:hypothetical protein n=1 Tax=Corynebacterium atrinae TaxID=1336740 RepID=UPI0025B4BC9E|nr:hypothetical protein [Corynebacterium atrinae]WJY62139.1 hypothetical protein CATRI_00080 [Corynebacterium atrinae]
MVDHHTDHGAVTETADGLTITTPTGAWRLDDAAALALATKLTSTLHARLTRPWDDTDTTSILDRGTNGDHSNAEQGTA